MDEWEELRGSLVLYVRRKFFSRPQIADVAEDIADEAIADVLAHGKEEKCNFYYLSKVCIHKAYRLFKQMDLDCKSSYSIELVDEADVVDEIVKSESATEILDSLKVLKQIERIIIVQRYYGDFSFSEIAQANGIKLNTVLSHHRRALEKLRPRLSMFASDRVKRRSISGHNACGNFGKLI